MNAEANQRKMGWFARRLIVLPALVVALGLAFTGAASAQTAFQASVTATGTLPSGGCANGAFVCGTANIAGYGAASWDFYVLTFMNVQSPCGTTYEAQTYFTLVSDPSSTLVVDEAGNLCGLGNDGAAYRGYFAEPIQLRGVPQRPVAYGHPYAIVGSWTVDSASTGLFSPFVGSTGTDLVNVAGAHAAGSYSGTLG